MNDQRDPIITAEADLRIQIAGKELKFNHFIPYDDNNIKLNIIDSDGESEGIWAVISDEDKKDYDANKHDSEYSRVALLRNVSILGIPWGTYVPYKLQGSNRPVFDFRDGIGGKMCFNQVDSLIRNEEKSE